MPNGHASHMNFARATALGSVIFACVAATGAPAASPAPAEPQAPDAVTHHTLALGTRTLDYTARAGTIVLHNDAGAPTGSMFYVAYTLDGGAPARRPVTFLYNGGPGSSTMWLHMGSFGPVRVATDPEANVTSGPPYRLVSNQETLLDRSDLVFVDMPDTGFGRIFGAGTPKTFFGVDTDVSAFAQFVERYISAFGRWNSPKFLYGESYGTTRSAALVNVLQQAGVTINGVVLQSSILNFGLAFGRNGDIGGNDDTFVFYLPTEAATAWYHRTLPDAPSSLPAFLDEVRAFSLGEYADALARGSTLPLATYNEIVAKLHRYTGLPAQFIRNSNLRVPYPRFETELLRQGGRVVGRLDSRYAMQSLDPLSNDPDDDAASAAISGPYGAAVNQYIRSDLGYHTSLLYQQNAYDAIRESGGWENKHNGNPLTDVSPDLAAAMVYDPHLRVFSANGYYDFATPYSATLFTLNHLGLDAPLRQNITYGFYQSGHMMYLVPSALAQLHDDLERWYSAMLGAS